MHVFLTELLKLDNSSKTRELLAHCFAPIRRDIAKRVLQSYKRTEVEAKTETAPPCIDLQPISLSSSYIPLVLIQLTLLTFTRI
jgi:hypothetical protein